MEDLATGAVFQIPIDSPVGFRAQRSADIVPLDDPALLVEIGMRIAHPIRERRRAARRRQLEGHVVPKVHKFVPRKKLFNGFSRTEVKRVIETGLVGHARYYTGMAVKRHGILAILDMGGAGGGVIVYPL